MYFTVPSITQLSNDAITRIRGRSCITCKKLSSIITPNVLRIDSKAFYNDSNISSVSFEKVENIYDRTFMNNTNLTFANIPSTKTIDNYVFYGCPKLSLVILSNMTEDKITTIGGIYAFGNPRAWPVSVYVPEGLQDKILENNTWAALTANNTITLVGVQK